MARYVELLFRHKVRFAALFLVPIVLGGAVTYVYAGYKATATLHIEDPSAFSASFVPVGWNANATPAQNLADSVGQVIKTPAFAQSLTNSLASSGATSSTTELQQTVSSIGANLAVNVAGTNLVALTYSCHRSALCTPVLSATVAVFQAQVVQLEQDRANASSNLWKSQLTDAQSSLTTAEADLRTYAAAHPGVTIAADSSDPTAVQLFESVQLWRAKALEAQDNLNSAQYLGTASARLLQVGTTVSDQPHLTGHRFIGDGFSLLPGGLVLVLGLLIIVAYLRLLVWADRTVGDPKALERRLGVPVVATIPKLLSTRGF